MSVSKCLRGLFLIVIVVFILIIGVPGFGQTAVPMRMNYQGLLTDRETGEPLEGTCDIVFRIYSDLTDTDPSALVWEETHAGVEVADGIFSVILGSTSALSTTDFSGPDRWLEMEVSGETLTPRQRMTSVAYSIISEDSRLLDGRESSEFADAVHAHSGSDITSGIVSHDRIDPLIARDTETDATVATHAAIANAHHERYDDSEAVAAMGVKSDTNPLHHDRYTDAEAVAAMGTKSDTNALHHDKTTSFGELTDSAGDEQIPATIARDTEVDSRISDHAAIADAHHTKTTTFAELTDTATDAQIPADIARDSEIMPTVLANDGTGSGLDADSVDGVQASDLEESTEIDADIAAHEAISDAHHTRYTDGEAVSAMGTKVDSNPLHHDKTTSFTELSDTASDAQIPATIARDTEVDSKITDHAAVPDAHHAKTTSFAELTDTATDTQIPDTITVNYATSAGDADTVDSVHAAALEESAEIDADITAHAGIANAHHERYTDSEAVAAMGAKADTNPLHHERYTEAEAVAAMGTKADANPLHHNKTTSFGELTDSASDTQIPGTIARDSEVTSEITTHAAIPDAHHARYTDTEAVSAMGTKSDANPLHHDKTTSLPWGSITSMPAGFADGVDNDSGAASWFLTGNSGTVPGVNFLGTKDNQALELRVANARALRLEPDAVSPNVIEGFPGNDVTAEVRGAAIGGGGEEGKSNRVSDHYGTVGGGTNNQAGNNAGTPDDADYATVGGGSGNTASGAIATVSGGSSNTASSSWATVGGGSGNKAREYSSTVGGGYGNDASSQWATVGGGDFNTASGERATVAGGSHNTASGTRATIGGGYYNTASGYTATIGGGYYNQANARWATIAGGGPSDTADALNTNNRVYDDYGTVGGGGYNRAGSDDGNTTTDRYATVGGGLGNNASADNSTVGGGVRNDASEYSSTVGGGADNTANGLEATVGGGLGNNASGSIATVGGGSYNTASGSIATVGGGSYNTASGWYATVAGGAYNTAAGDYSFAGGRRAMANRDGCFVWGDSTDANVYSTNVNQFIARACNGVLFYSNAARTTGVRLPPGGGSWSSISDPALKDNPAPTDAKEVLKQLMSVPISTWNYIAQDPSIRHMGPMAQDFYAAFGLGEDNKHISTVDADGVAMAAIQGLHEIVQEKEGRIFKLEQRNADLEERLEALEALVVKLTNGKDNHKNAE